MVFSIFTKLCNYHHYLISKIFSSPAKKKSHSCQRSLPSSPSPAPGNQQSAFCLCRFASLWTFRINGFIQPVTFRVWLFLLSMLFSRSVHVVARVRISFLFHGWILFCCRDMTPFFYLFIHWWTFGLFPLFSRALNLILFAIRGKAVT